MVETLSPAHLSDIRAFKTEWTVLRECVSPVRDAGQLRKMFPSVDWSRMMLLAQQHGVIGHLAACLSNLGPFAISPDAKQALMERQRAQNFLTLQLTAELFRLLEIFAAKRIAALVIKGPVLAMRAYGNLAVRTYGDLDLLVRPKDIRRATESMLASGYEAAVSLDLIDAGKIPGQYLFSKPDSQLLVEVHNELTLRYFPRPLPIEDFFARHVHLGLDGHEVPALSMEDGLVLICIHGAKHFWERLMWIADVAGLISRQSGMDWERAITSAKAVRAGHLLHTGLRLAVEVLHASLPDAVSAAVLQDAAAATLVTQILRWLPAAGHAPPSLFERAAFRLRMRGGVFLGPAYLLRLSLSPTEEDWQVGDKISHNRFLNGLRRPFRLARKYGRSGRA
jgi:hypothetical protein